VKELVCIVCPNGCVLKIEKQNDKWQIEGNLCHKGKDFAIEEMTTAKRTITTTVKTSYKKLPYLPVRTDKGIPKKLIFPLMKLINEVIIKKPVHSGEIILENVFDSGVNVISTSDMYYILEGEFNE